MNVTKSARLGWETYANQEMLAIHSMSAAERTQSIDQLRHACASMGGDVPMEDVQSILEHPRGITMKELELRAAFQLIFERFSVDVLQSHFTYFQQKERIIEGVITAVTRDNTTEQSHCARRAAIRVIIDEIGKSLLRKGTQPQTLSAAEEQKA